MTYLEGFKIMCKISEINCLFWSMPVILLIAIYIAGFIHNYMKRAICTCGEHFSFLGLLQSIIWFIYVPIEMIINKIKGE